MEAQLQPYNQQSDVLKGLKMRELLDNDLKIQVGFKKKHLQKEAEAVKASTLCYVIFL